MILCFPNCISTSCAGGEIDPRNITRTHVRFKNQYLPESIYQRDPNEKRSDWTRDKHVKLHSNTVKRWLNKDSSAPREACAQINALCWMAKECSFVFTIVPVQYNNKMAHTHTVCACALAMPQLQCHVPYGTRGGAWRLILQIKAPRLPWAPSPRTDGHTMCHYINTQSLFARGASLWDGNEHNRANTTNPTDCPSQLWS